MNPEEKNYWRNLYESAIGHAETALEEFIYKTGTPSNLQASKILNAFISPPTRLTKMPDIFERFIHHSYNRQMGPNVIGKRLNEKELNNACFGYDPKQVYDKFGDPDAESGTEKNWSVFRKYLIEHSKNLSGIEQYNHNNSYWVIFCKSILSNAAFLKDDNFLKTLSLVNGPFGIDHIRLLLEIDSKIHGYGLALACDVLKESGLMDVIKPDTHIKKIFLLEDSPIKYDKNRTNDLLYIISGSEISEVIGVPAYSFDKLFWFLNSGKLHLRDNQPDIEKFIRHTSEENQILISKQWDNFVNGLT